MLPTAPAGYQVRGTRLAHPATRRADPLSHGPARHRECPFLS